MNAYKTPQSNQLLIHNLSPKSSKSKIKLSRSQFQKSNFTPFEKKNIQQIENNYDSDYLYQAYTLKDLVKNKKRKGESNSKSSYTSRVSQSNLNRGYLVRVVYAENHIIHGDQDFLSLMQLYSNQQVSFVSIYGNSSSGKSFLLDTLLHLSQNAPNGQKQFQRKKPGKAVSLFTYSIPFQKGNKRIFLLDLQNYYCSQILSVQQKMILNILISLSSTVLILPQPNDFQAKILNLTASHFEQRMQHLASQAQYTLPKFGYWPNHVYCLYRSSQTRTINGNQHIQYLFQNFSFVILQNAFDNKRKINSQYLKNLSLLFRDVYDKIKTKQFSKLKYTGRVVVGLITNLVHYTNKGTQFESYDYLDMKKIFYEITKEIYQSTYNYQLIIYNKKLEKMLNTQDPRSLDQMIQIFQQASQYIVEDFIHFNVNPQLQEKYQQKLLKHIQEKQQILLQINQKKTKKKLKKQLQGSKFVFNVSDFKGQLWNLKTNYPNIDHGKAEVIGNRLKKVIADMQENPNIEQPQQDQQRLQSLNRRKNDLHRISRQSKLFLLNKKKQEERQKQKYQEHQQKNKQMLKKLEKIKSQLNEIRGSKQKKSNNKYKSQFTSYKNQQVSFQHTQSLKKQKKAENHKQLEELRKEWKKAQRQAEAMQLNLAFFNRETYEDDDIKQSKKRIKELVDKQDQFQVQIWQIQNLKKRKDQGYSVPNKGISSTTMHGGIDYTNRAQFFRSQNPAMNKSPSNINSNKNDFISANNKIVKKNSANSGLIQQGTLSRMTQINNKQKKRKPPIRVIQERDLEAKQLMQYEMKGLQKGKYFEKSNNVIK